MSALYLNQATAIFLLIAGNLAITGCLGWKWSLWPVPDWLAVQQSKAVFFLILYDSINDMKHFWNFPASHLSRATAIFVVDCCQFWSKLDFWAENGGYGLCRLGKRYNGAKLYFSWPYMIVLIIWNTSETICITPQPCHSHHIVHRTTGDRKSVV